MNHVKPLGRRAYGSIPHLIGSRRGEGDHGVEVGTHNICTQQCRKGDRVIVEEKLDGSCVAIAKVDGEIVPLMRAGYRAKDSKFEQHHLFHDWAMKRLPLWQKILINDRDRLAGEWLAQVHGTRYSLGEIEPFAPFDLFAGGNRVPRAFFHYWTGFLRNECIFPPLQIWNAMRACPIEYALEHLSSVGGHRNDDPVEGAVWRVEIAEKVEIVAKYVRPEKVDGFFLETKTGKDPVWNWRP